MKSNNCVKSNYNSNIVFDYYKKKLRVKHKLILVILKHYLVKEKYA